ncbi:adenylyl-sulfate kinase [Aneurinibacillus sp. Ricciae_BoGa-3]|uniref:adenylyl-sulfate kinase n=1 Tax=Aneurinibacillus sp. Ricciae_BoGa-3 TaxID=3022697 RepID=UPI002341B36A|nr:adenylyl-sulfate kinase [Aneurinibacillus sp. Ricciae_BoGa-3]WCK55337.1 adenylyl-sulfate kinase [Aneurinibacillus sp. Ricciae_BoGa-3]
MAQNIVWHNTTVTKKDRQELNGHKSGILWFTGLSASGKSTLANVLEKELHTRGLRTYLLDGDNIRHGINKDLGFSPEDRTENIRRIGEVAKLFVDAGALVLTAFISPYQADRQLARSLVDEGEFIEIYVKCSIETCEQRDPKGLYKKAKNGEIPQFTGISSPYEEPEKPELIVENDKQTLQQSVEQIITYLEEKGFI